MHSIKEIFARRGFAITVFAIFLFGLLLSQESLAQTAWNKYRRADVALALTRNANFALGIGNFYFNGPAGAYDLKKAEAGFKRAVKIDGKILWGHYQLARIYFVRGESEKALSEINKELEANPENLRSLYVRGLILADIGDLEEAEGDFRRFTSWAPREWAGHNDLAWVLAKQGKYEEARDEILRAFADIKEADGNVWLQNSLGVAYLNIKNYKEAKKAFSEAKKLAEDMATKEWLAAYPGNNPKDAEEGLEAFKKAIEINIEKSILFGG